MKVEIKASNMKAALDVAGKGVSRDKVWPVLEHVLLEAHADGGLTMTATDFRLRASLTVPAAVEQDGAVALPPKRLDDLIASVDAADRISLSVDEGHHATLTSGRAVRVRIAGLAPDGFPVAPSFDEPSSDLTVPTDTLRTLIESVGRAAARDDSRPVLAGIAVRIEGGALRMAAADGFRLAVRSTPVDAADGLDVIADARSLGRLASGLVGAAAARLTVDARRSMLRIETEGGQWSVALIDGSFPDFLRIIPKDVPIVVSLDRTDLMRAARLLNGVVETGVDAHGRAYATAITRLAVSEHETRVHASDKDGNHAAEIVLPSARVRGADMSVAYNAGYLRAAVEAFDGPRLTLDIGGTASPLAIWDGVSRDHLHVVMPMHVARP